MKKRLQLLVCLILVLSLSSCSLFKKKTDDDIDENDFSSSQSESMAPETDDEPEGEPENTPSPTPSPSPSPTPTSTPEPTPTPSPSPEPATIKPLPGSTAKQDEAASKLDDSDKEENKGSEGLKPTEIDGENILNGSIIEGTINTITIEDTSGAVYTFITESADKSNAGEMVIGNKVTVHYTGDLRNANDVVVSKIIQN